MAAPIAESERIDIAFGFDLAYAPHVASVIASLVRHAPDARLRFLMLAGGLDTPTKTKLQSVAPAAEMVWIEAGEAVPEMAERGHISRATLFRLGLEHLAPADCTRLIYLDADLIVLGDIRELWRTDLAGKPIAAAVDSFIDGDTLSRWEVKPPGQYFNAGVLVIDLAKVRAERLFSAALEFQIQHGAELPYNDQDALNWAFWNNWRRLDNNWNIQRHMVIAELEPDRRLTGAPLGIVHFTCADKPWLRDIWHPWAWIYWDNLARTPFFHDVAAREGVSFLRRRRMQLRWLRRRPPA